ncbi:hypothetical protein SAMN06298211_103176 [Prevotellaceae bacterium MN60]|jgi:hypothetical protein|nr:hypothetical protein SAMN06298211_103176 [Prevotellaceae bacterium MN60]
MEQFNRDRYKKQSLLREFSNSCAGRLIIFAGILLVLYVVALATIPSNDKVMTETMDNIHECLQDNDSIKADELDETLSNISRTLMNADTTYTNPEMLKMFHKYNRLEVYRHPGYKTVHVINGLYPQGRRISIGVFGCVISTIHYTDLVLSTGAARGDYGKSLRVAPEDTPEIDLGENANVEPYHYQGNPDY